MPVCCDPFCSPPRLVSVCCVALASVWPVVDVWKIWHVWKTTAVVEPSLQVAELFPFVDDWTMMHSFGGFENPAEGVHWNAVTFAPYEIWTTRLDVVQFQVLPGQCGPA